MLNRLFSKCRSSLLLLLLLPFNASATGVLIMGDSISAGYGLPEKSGWVELLSERLKEEQMPFSVTNLSISGETTSGGLARLPSALNKHFPQVVVIELGGNDGLRGTPLRAIEQNLMQMVQLAKDNDAEVVLLGMRIPPNYGRPYAEGFYNLFAKVAKQYDVAYVPFFLEGVGGDPELMQGDGIHPNQPAQALLLENAWPTLESTLTKISQ